MNLSKVSFIPKPINQAKVNPTEKINFIRNYHKGFTEVIHIEDGFCVLHWEVESPITINLKRVQNLKAKIAIE